MVLFGSELKALMAHPAWQAEIDLEATAAFVRYSYVPTPATIFRNVHKLPPASILAVRAGETPRIAPYWRLRDAVAAGAGRPPASEEEAAEKLEAILRDSVRGRMIADVPLGAFLSGGIDSSTVVALMQAQSSRKVRTFSIGFREPGYDEAQHAKAVAAHLGTDHTELYVTPREAIDVVPRLPEWFDEPFADSSQIPTYLVSAMTRQARHRRALRRRRRRIVRRLSALSHHREDVAHPRDGAASPARRGRAPRSARCRSRCSIRLFAFAPARLRPLNAGSKVRRLAALLSEPSVDGLAVELAAIWAHERRLVPAAKGAYRLRTEHDLAALVPDPVSRMQYYDTLTYLPDDIMTKVDRCSMAVALEAREPMLDHRLVEFAWTLPPRFKFDGKQSKRLLRKVLYRYVPRELVERPKMGFSIPLAAWLRGDLRGMGGRSAVARPPRCRRHLRCRRSAAPVGPAPVGRRQPGERVVERADVPGLETALPGVGDAHGRCRHSGGARVCARAFSPTLGEFLRNNPMQSTFRRHLAQRAVASYLKLA